MKLKFSPCGGAEVGSLVEFIDENTLEINGELYHFPVEFAEFDPAGPVLAAHRDDLGELWVVLQVRYSVLDREVWETQNEAGRYRGQDWETWDIGSAIVPITPPGLLYEEDA